MPFQYLSQPEIQEIHAATLRVLSEVGIKLDDVEARSILFDHGAWEKGGMVCLPADLVESSVGFCPPKVILKGRGGETTLGDGNLHVHNTGGAREVLDHPGSSLRPATRSDVAQSTRLMDALENVDTITPLYTPRDVPGSMMVVAMFEQLLRNTRKPINGPGVRNVKELNLIAQMAQVVLGEGAQVPMSASPVSPLNFSGEIAQVMLAIARLGLPFGPLPCPIVGATSPMSLAGSLVQQNAEVLASIVLVQLAAPGLPVIYCGRLSPLNMRSGAPIWGNPEVGMMSAATVQIGHSYHLPVNVYGLAGSGYSPDMQNGYERAINALVPALAGADELSGVGEMAGGVCSSNAQIVVDNDIIGMVKRVRRGFVVDEDSLAVKVITHAMQTTRNFMSEPHTRNYLRAGEVWQGQLGIQEVVWDQWQAAGSPDVLRRAQALTEKLLATHDVEPLDEVQSRTLDEIIQAAVLILEEE